MDLDKLEQTIEYSFLNKSLLHNALRHSSYTNENKMSYFENNERLEFLGDAVLQIVSSEFIYKKYPKIPEGEMTNLRSGLVCETSLAISARQINLGDYIYLSKGEKQGGGNDRDSILSDAFEATIGAIYLDGGMKNAKAFIERFLLSEVDNRKMIHGSKNYLQEIVQKKYTIDKLIYKLIDENGPDHDKVYTVQCIIDGKKYGVGVGKTKKKAEQNAAYETIMMLQ